MIHVRAADAPDAIDRAFVANLTAERIARIGWVRNKPARANDLHDRGDLTRLRVCRVNFNESGHARIVWEQSPRA